MIGLEGEVFIVQIKGENTVEPTVEAVGWCNEICACIVVHCVNSEAPINALVDLWKKIDKVEAGERFLIVKNGLVAYFFTEFQAKWVIVIQIPIPVWQVQPRLQPWDIHPSVGDGANCCVDFSRRHVISFNEQLFCRFW